MANYKNQRRVYFDEDLGPIEHQKEQEECQFLIALDWNCLLDVMSDLEAPEFILWEYMLKWRGPRKKDENKRYYDFSPADLKVHFGWSENSSRHYFEQLEKKGYVVTSNHKTFKFIPYPPEVAGRAAIKRENNRAKLDSAKNSTKI